MQRTPRKSHAQQWNAVTSDKHVSTANATTLYECRAKIQNGSKNLKNNTWGVLS